MSIKRIISCSDIHIPSLKGMDELKEHLQRFILQCHKVVANGESADDVRIVVGGDLFHNKIAITNESIITAYWFLSELGKVAKTIVFAGNHDMLMNNTDRVDSITPIFEIGELQNVVYLDKEMGYKSGIYEDDNVAWCLFSSFSGFNTPDIKMHKETNKDKKFTYVGLIHADVNGAITVTNYTTDNGIDPSVFEDCDFVIAGHIHKRQEIKKNGVRIVYCSSIKQRDFGESVTGHGFILWDIEDPEDITYKSVNIPDEDGGYYKFTINDISDLENDKEELMNY